MVLGKKRSIQITKFQIPTSTYIFFNSWNFNFQCLKKSCTVSSVSPWKYSKCPYLTWKIPHTLSQKINYILIWWWWDGKRVQKEIKPVYRKIDISLVYLFDMLHDLYASWLSYSIWMSLGHLKSHGPKPINHVTYSSMGLVVPQL